MKYITSRLWKLLIFILYCFRNVLIRWIVLNYRLKILFPPILICIVRSSRFPKLSLTYLIPSSHFISIILFGYCTFYLKFILLFLVIIHLIVSRHNLIFVLILYSISSQSITTFLYHPGAIISCMSRSTDIVLELQRIIHLPHLMFYQLSHFISNSI